MNSEMINSIRRTATERLESMTEYCSYRDGYPHFIHDLFYLYSFVVSRSLSRYYDEFGYTEISLDNVISAKQFFKYPPVSQFEKESITMLNDYLARRDRESKLLPMHYTGKSTNGPTGGNPNGLAAYS